MRLGEALGAWVSLVRRGEVWLVRLGRLGEAWRGLRSLSRLTEGGRALRGLAGLGLERLGSLAGLAEAWGG